MKKYLCFCLFLICSCGEKVVYKTQEEMNSLRKQETWELYKDFLPQETELVEVLPSEKWNWCIIKIKNNYYLYHIHFAEHKSVEAMVPFNYTEK